MKLWGKVKHRAKLTGSFIKKWVKRSWAFLHKHATWLVVLLAVAFSVWLMFSTFGYSAGHSLLNPSY